jgi:uncharacterized protein YkwD
MSRRKISIVGLVVVVLVAGTAARVRADDLGRRNKMLRILNQTRRSHGLPAFRLNANLSHFAWQHSGRMADRRGLFHTPDLYQRVRAYHPSTWGENVGMAGLLRTLRTLWMQSAPHRANLLNRRFRRIGIGVVRARGMLWATTIFYGG